MKSLALAGSRKPKVRPGDFERALALIVEFGGDKSTKAYLADLVAAEAEADKARTVAEADKAEASRRETAAMAAEADARSQREALATETAETDRRLTTEGAKVAAERERLEDLAKDLDAKRLDLQLRESAIQRAFAAYEGD